MYLVGALLSLAAAGKLTFTWTDTGDSTCGGLYRPNLWSGYCDDLMIPRLAAVLGLVAFAVMCAWVERRRLRNRRGSPDR